MISLKATIEMVKNWGASHEPGDGGFCPCTFSFIRAVMVGYVHMPPYPPTHPLHRTCGNVFAANVLMLEK